MELSPTHLVDNKLLSRLMSSYQRLRLVGREKIWVSP